MKNLLNKPYFVLGFLFSMFVTSLVLYVSLNAYLKNKEVAGRANMIQEINTLNRMGLEKVLLVKELVEAGKVDPRLQKHIIAFTMMTTPEYAPDTVLEQIYKTFPYQGYNKQLILKLLSLSSDDEAFRKVVDISTLDEKIIAQQKIVEKAILY